MSDDTEQLNGTLAKLGAITIAVVDGRHEDVRVLIDDMFVTEVRDCLGQACLLIATMARASGMTDGQLRSLLADMALRLAAGDDG